MNEHLDLTGKTSQKLLNSLGIYIEHSRHNICYEGYISRESTSYERIIHYYKIQKNITELPNILKLKTPSIIRIFTDNNITYTFYINGMQVGLMEWKDVDYIFRAENREFKLKALLENKYDKNY